MRWGFRFMLLSALLLALSGSTVSAEEPVYEEAPVYSPAPEAGKIRFAGLRLNRRSGTAILFVRVLEPGRVVLHGRGIRRLTRGVPQAKLVRLPVKPKVRLRRYLKRHGEGRIRPLVTLRPLAGTLPKTIERVIVLHRKRG
ncbi:MAG TPA: hypothetical protein VIS95_02910 [Solirubrobacterales bacterium]